MLQVRVQVGVHTNSFRGCLGGSLPPTGSIETQSREQICFPTTLIAISRRADGQNIVLVPEDRHRQIV